MGGAREQKTVEIVVELERSKQTAREASVLTQSTGASAPILRQCSACSTMTSAVST
jgi:hypothetical protein